MTSPLDYVSDSLLRRMSTMHSLYYEAVGTMTLEQVSTVIAELPIWNDDWSARVKLAIDDHGKDRPVEEMIDQRIGDYEAFKAYQRAVLTRTETHIETMDPADFERVIIAPPYPPMVQNTYSERCAGPQGITVLDAFECWHYQRGLRHMGEIEMIRGHFGLGGVTA
ncbi:MAG: hypothetical protein GY745_19715 [Actinomycetia bacterium]|nr:hypothetical protein [Actinomycetes bacterium]